MRLFLKQDGCERRGLRQVLSWWNLLWLLLGGLGVFAFVMLAVARGETVNALWIVLASVCVMVLAYRFHSAWLTARVLTLDTLRATPAVVHSDGRDFVPTNKWIVFGHHFAAIAGPGPLVGPVLAAQFGYLPGLLWMLVGATLGGAVHDSIVLFCSIRRRGKSLSQMLREEVGPAAGWMATVGVLAIMVILLAVLALVVVKALAESPWGFFTILASIPIAVAMGVVMRKRWLSLGWTTVFGTILLLVSVVLGQWIHGTVFEQWFSIHETSLAWGIMGYSLAASILPIWLLLAPRDYLSAFLKLGAMALLVVAVVSLAPTLKMPAVTKFVDGSGLVFAGPVFPFCFITIACAAVSGFHALIASGTTPKLVANERDIRFVGYGAMVVEMLVGVMALVAACSMEPGAYFAINMKGAPEAVVAKVTEAGFPVTVAQMDQLAASVGEKSMVGRTGGGPTFAVGMAQMFAGVFQNRTALALWYHFAIMFEAMFILTTIDAGTRVGRFLVQEVLGAVYRPLGNTRSAVGCWLASILFITAWGYFLYQGVLDPLGGVNSLWPIFGVANQLLAVLALALGATVLVKMGRARYAWVALGPLLWLSVVTLSAGWMKIFSEDPRLGFLRAAADFRAKIAIGGTADEAVQWETLLISNYVNAGVVAIFLVLVVLTLACCARVWIQCLWAKYSCELHEEPRVELNASQRAIVEMH